MVVWFSSGLPLTAFMTPVLRFVSPMVLLIALLSLFVSPWALSQSAQYRQQIEARNDVSKVAPGSFRESAGADRVFFVESISEDASLIKNVFVSATQNGRLGVMVAATARMEQSDNGDRFLVLERGRRYEGEPGTPQYRVMEFERYAIRIEAREARAQEAAPRHLPLSHLLAHPTNPHKAELLWRIGLPISALMLALLAIPLSFVNPRAGRANNLIFALLVFMVYSNLLSLCQAWVAQGRLAFEMGAAAVHVGMFGLLALLFYRRIAVAAGFRWRR
jgi:lipopolysaccharide export system permease protein